MKNRLYMLLKNFEDENDLTKIKISINSNVLRFNLCAEIIILLPTIFQLKIKKKQKKEKIT